MSKSILQVLKLRDRRIFNVIMKLILAIVLVLSSEIKCSYDCRLSAYPPDPNSGCCGKTTKVFQRKVGSSVEIGEYPWMGLVEYRTLRDIQWLCAAVLISGRYALSAAQCFIKKEHQTPINVRFGEYDTRTEGPDCVEGPSGPECTDGAIRIAIEKATQHPNYSKEKKRDDIALIKLAEEAPFTDFIRPICLPTLDFTINPPKRFFMAVAGWGAANYILDQSSVLRQVLVPYVDYNICRTKYNTIHTNVEVTDRLICAGSKNRDSCQGDAGGPMMYRYRNITELAGVVSFGPRICGTDIPSGYTKVFAYKEWIQKTIEEEEIGETTTNLYIDTDLIYFKE